MDRGERGNQRPERLPGHPTRERGTFKTRVWRGLLHVNNTPQYLSQFYGMVLLRDDKVQALYNQRVSRFWHGMLFRESFGFHGQFVF
jgi:hypothetical protein